MWEKEFEQELGQARKEAREFDQKLLNYWKNHKPKGFFELPWEKGCWSASVLVQRALERRREEEDDFLGIEFGGMPYLLGEALHAWDGRLVGEYYPYQVFGEHDHDHDFLSVLQRAILSDGQLEAEQGERYYAPWMLEKLNLVQEHPGLRQVALPWAQGWGYDPFWEEEDTGQSTQEEHLFEKLMEYCPALVQPLSCYTGETLRTTYEIEEIYAWAARCPDSFRLGEYEILYSREQKACIEGILAYQRAALAGEAL